MRTRSQSSHLAQCTARAVAVGAEAHQVALAATVAELMGRGAAGAMEVGAMVVARVVGVTAAAATVVVALVVVVLAAAAQVVAARVVAVWEVVMLGWVAMGSSHAQHWRAAQDD